SPLRCSPETRTKEPSMKRCNTCNEEFENQFSFCPIDGRPLTGAKRAAKFEYRPTLISEKSLGQRLLSEAQFLFTRLEQAWPRFKAEPAKFAAIQLRLLRENAKRIVSRPYFATASLSAISIILVLVTGVLVSDWRHRSDSVAAVPDDDLVPITTISLRSDDQSKSDPGIGAGNGGRVGFNQGRGEGSGPKPAQSRGGGGSGNLTQLPQSQGRIPVPSVIPAPISTTYARLPRSLP